jgi:hypothetical protein
MAFDGENLQAGTLNRQLQDNAAIIFGFELPARELHKKSEFLLPQSSTIGVPLRLSVRRWYSELSVTRPQLY